MRFTVVIPTFESGGELGRTLATLTTQTFDDYEVVVVDDGSTDETAAMVEREFPAVRLIRQSHRGPAAARNRGIAVARGALVAFTDADCVPPPDWLARLGAGYERHPAVAGVGGALAPRREALQESRFARYEQHVARAVYGAADREHAGGFECPAGGTGNMSYRRRVLEEVGGFDETFAYPGGEDADLKRRVCQTGVPLLFVPVTVEHGHPYGWTGFRRRAYARGRGRARFDAKHGSGATRLGTALRLLRRWLDLPVDLGRAERRPYALLRAAEAWLQARGEWDMVAEMRTWTSST